MIGRLVLSAWLLGVAPLAVGGETKQKSEEPAAAEAGAEHQSAGEDHGGEQEDGRHRAGGGHHDSRISDQALPLQTEGFPQRPRYLLELGNPYLGTGRIRPGIQLPTGAVWQPSLIVFGTLRSALQSFEAEDLRVTELAVRLDLFANLQLSGTERLVVGVRALDQDGRFTGYLLEPSPGDPGYAARFGARDRFEEELNLDIESLFFEGDFGEIFPDLDRDDSGSTDVGFSIGRQPLSFQEGILINDTIDGVGLTRNSLLPANTSNFRATLFAGLDNIERANRDDRSANLYALLTSTDFRRSTLDADLVWVRAGESSGDLVTGGVSAVQRIGKINTSFRLLASRALDRETPFATDGALAFSEVSWTPPRTHDLVYVNSFWAVDEFSSAARSPVAGGPLGRAGINFAAVGLGSYGAPLSSRARDVVGGALGYQKFFGPAARRQVLTELGARVGTTGPSDDQVALTVRYQTAVGQRVVLVADGFSGLTRRAAGGDDTRFGGRFEVVVKF